MQPQPPEDTGDYLGLYRDSFTLIQVYKYNYCLQCLTLDLTQDSQTYNAQFVPFAECNTAHKTGKQVEVKFTLEQAMNT